MPPNAQQVCRFLDFTLDSGRGLRRADGTGVPLRAKSLDLLLYLAANAGRVVSKDELIEAVWNGLAVTDDSLTQTIHDVRRALADTEQSLIRTVPRRGYMLAGQVAADVPALATSSGTVLPAMQLDGPSLAVLPFLNLSGDPAQDYFADGMAEEIITALTRMKWLLVIARNSSFAYKGRAADAKTVGRDLGVRYVLEGSVRKFGGRVRVSAQLVDAETGIQLWAERFDGTLEDIFDLQDQVTGKVVGAIAPRLELAEINRVKRKATESLQAHDYYLRALAAFYRITRTGNDEALANIKRAIEIDPSYAIAYGFGARTYIQRNSGAWVEDFDREFGEAERLARRAIELGQDDAVALSCAAFALSDLCGDPKSAIICVDKAIALSPSLASAWLYSSWIRCAVADIEVALEHIRMVRRLSPNDPQTYSINCCEGNVHFAAGNYRQALAGAEAAMQVKSDFILSHCLALASAANAGLAEETETALRRTRQIAPDLTIERVRRIQPFYNGDVEQAWFSGLRKAGLPD